MKLIVGNWKMNGLAADSRQRVEGLALSVRAHPLGAARLVICPPVTALGVVRAGLERSGIELGAQDCHARESGAFTGDLSAAMLKDAGCAYVIVGHSERRQGHGETDALVAAKAAAAHAAGLIAIVCVGETEKEREEGRAEEIVTRQIKQSLPPGAAQGNTVLAYEPVWAIGTGKTATPEDIRAMHATIRAVAGQLPILYGGSVKADNAAAILSTANVDGALVGGASLKADEFIAIARSTG